MRASTPRQRRGVRPMCLLALVALAACSHLPANDARRPSQAIPATSVTRLGEALAAPLAQHPGRSAFHPLGNGLDAFVARLAFAEFADRSIDVQYYLFHDDRSGRTLTAYLLDAADRGVRVRVLLDDMDMTGRDAGLASIGLHPNIEIRLFNPFPSRSLRVLNFLTHFGTVTRRMHNKAFVVDNRIAIVGGRNIGDEYFDAAQGMNFGDMDVLAAGPIVDDVSESFDRYWNSDLAYPVTTLGARGDRARYERGRAALDETRAALGGSEYGARLRASNLARALVAGQADLYWAPSQLLYDLPDKVRTDPEDRSTHLGPELEDLLGSARSRLTAISPYFVPGKRGARLLAELAERGVAVTVVTNSLASTDVPAVHAGYVRYRRALLKAGVEIFEVRPTAAGDEDDERRFGSAQSSLHAKTFAIDDGVVLVGSMNMDPRSDLLNTEMGILINSPQLASALELWRREALPQQAWRVTLEGLDTRGASGAGSMQWFIREGNRDVLAYESEPEASLPRRIVAGLLRWLPIEKQL